MQAGVILGFQSKKLEQAQLMRFFYYINQGVVV